LALVVEDDPSLLSAMSRTLAENDFDIREALDFETAVRHLRECEPHIACIDLELPHESGYELCEYVRSLAAFSTLPIIVTSERGYPLDMAHAEDAGANAYLKKPFPMTMLLRYVEALLHPSHETDPSMLRLRPM
jgi:DNA-binding response OmpR family regulator